MGAFDDAVAVVVGAGVAGASAARVLAEEGATVRVSEARDAAVPELVAAGVDVRSGAHRPEHLDDATLVVVSPGVRPDSPVLAWAAERGLPVWGELELGSRLARVPYLAVTGTNGKTTTSGMLTACLRASGIDAIACGNIGRPFPATARETHDVLVVEASSFQLAMQTSFHPRVSVLLNVAEDHLDWHGSFDAYVDAKARIFANQIGSDVHVGNHDDATSADVSGRARCDTRWFGAFQPGPGDVGIVDGALVAGWSDVALRPSTDDGPVLVDAAAATVAAHAFGIGDDAIAHGLRTYRAEPHRGEIVVEIDGVRFVDNSKATNPHAAIAAAAGYDRFVLIAGGDAKGVDLSPLGSLAPRLSGVVAIGAAAGAVRAVFDGKAPVGDASSIEEATRLAFEMTPRGGTVLLAPACASWDMFRDYAERGERFAAAAREIKRQDART
ncbi:MAG TPA: UDP-N-acetylmuramoyl-L-alanine--D-glutamate ligase [Actinomycetota bacterium]|nr:UDP-N-acetylmuramoyl-L-alanine--D-glutamate ligase [Actinomycetota bacterium]